jgi:hypothetical protein
VEQNNWASQETRANAKIANNNQNSFVVSSASLAEDSNDIEMMVDEKYKENAGKMKMWHTKVLKAVERPLVSRVRLKLLVQDSWQETYSEQVGYQGIGNRKLTL